MRTLAPAAGQLIIKEEKGKAHTNIQESNYYDIVFYHLTYQQIQPLLKYKLNTVTNFLN